MATYLLPLVSLMVVRAWADSHSLHYVVTAVASPGSELPEYSLVGYVDNKEITNYNSDTRQCLPKVEGLKKLGADYWESRTQKTRGGEFFFKHNIHRLMTRFNLTGGFHYFQRRYGCELRDDGSTSWYYQYGYDGRDFVYLDTERGLWIPIKTQAEIFTQGWDSPELREGERWKNYLETECIDMLRRYLDNSREDLERRVRPEVKVWGRQSGEVTKLHCLVYGFHPRAVDVKWVRNGEHEVTSLEAKTILPHPDGTYQIRVTAEVPTREGDSYSCHVDHSSLEPDILKVKWEPDNGLPLNVIIGVIAGLAALAALAAVIAGVIVYMRKRSGYKTTSTSDSNSDSISNPTA